MKLSIEPIDNRPHLVRDGVIIGSLRDVQDAISAWEENVMGQELDAELAVKKEARNGHSS